jgi:diguanylate cyclase (GGDEF)-like protein
MKAPEKPANEAERLASLRNLGILDTPAEERFDRITRLTRRVLGTKYALISLVDAERQWFKSAQGLDTTETSREVSFCGHAIHDDETLVVPNAPDDPRFADNPLVTGEPNVRFYAGQPIKSLDGYLVGTLCVIDTVPRELPSDDVASLKDLAALVEKELRLDELSLSERELRGRLEEAELKAATDALTRVWNRAIITELLGSELERSARENVPVGVAMIDIDHFKQINDNHGHLAGDSVLRSSAARIRQGVRPYDSIGRYGGEEFLAVFPNCDADEVRQVAERIRECLVATPVAVPDGTLAVTASLGVYSRVAEANVEPEHLIEAADRALYKAKEAGRNRVELFSG